MDRSLWAPLVFGLLGIGILGALGVWQVQRLAYKESYLAEMEARMAGAPQPLPLVADPQRDRFARVLLSGRLQAKEAHVLGSLRGVGPIYRVITPFELEGNRRILVDLGWIPVRNKESSRSFAGSTTVGGHLHWPDERTTATPPNDMAANIWYARDVEALAAALETEAILLVANRVVPALGSVTPLPLDTRTIPNNHLSYAATWFGLAIVWAMMTLYYLRRTHHQRRRGPSPERGRP